MKGIIIHKKEKKWNVSEKNCHNEKMYKVLMTLCLKKKIAKYKCNPTGVFCKKTDLSAGNISVVLK